MKKSESSQKKFNDIASVMFSEPPEPSEDFYERSLSKAERFSKKSRYSFLDKLKQFSRAGLPYIFPVLMLLGGALFFATESEVNQEKQLAQQEQDVSLEMWMNSDEQQKSFDELDELLSLLAEE